MGAGSVSKSPNKRRLNIPAERLWRKPYDSNQHVTASGYLAHDRGHQQRGGF
jgi:hypothetical protein